MGLQSDRNSALTGLSLLLSRIKDSARNRQLPPEDWCIGICALALEACEQDTPDTNFADLYKTFVHCVPPDRRAASLSQLGSFVAQRHGAGWRALLLFMRGEQDNPALCARAAHLTATLAQPQESHPFAGAEAVLATAVNTPELPAAAPAAILNLADLRLLPLLTAALDPAAQRTRDLLRALNGTSLNSLSSAWLLQLLTVCPSLQDDVADALCRFAAQSKCVQDVVYPIPTWQYKDARPVVLHEYAPADYYARLRGMFGDRLSDAQYERLRGICR